MTNRNEEDIADWFLKFLKTAGLNGSTEIQEEDLQISQSYYIYHLYYG